MRGALNAEGGAEWTVELAMRHEDTLAGQPDFAAPPAVGGLWRINFSRVEKKGDVNWVWSPQVAAPSPCNPTTLQPCAPAPLHPCTPAPLPDPQPSSSTFTLPFTLTLNCTLALTLTPTLSLPLALTLPLTPSSPSPAPAPYPLPHQVVWDANHSKHAGIVGMHLPDAWGWVQFAPAEGAAPLRDVTWPARLAALNLYYAQQLYLSQTGNFSTTLSALRPYLDAEITSPFELELEARGNATFNATVTYGAPPDELRVRVREDRLVRVVDRASHAACAGAC